MHIPVLLKEVLRYLDPKPGENFIDCTIGQGGHAKALMERISPGGNLLGIDADAESLMRLEAEIKDTKAKNGIILVNGNFTDIADIVEQRAFGPVHGILMDLGWSSWQMEEGKRGLSFLRDEALDMRMSSLQALTAEQVVNTYTEETLAKIFKEFGEERFSRSIARAICEKRTQGNILRTRELAQIIVNAVPPPFRHGKIHAATRTFQALRIAVNNELEHLQKALPEALGTLAPGGRIAVISFHSLEDRIVKNFFREKKREGRLAILTKKPVTASLEEGMGNPRSRSAKLRAAIKSS